MLDLALAEPSATVWSVEENLGASRELDSLDDALLLARVAAEDRVAFRVLHRRYAGRVLGYLRRVVRDSASAEDLVQEVFLGVWRQARGYRSDRGAVGAWLFGIVRNKLFDARRRGAVPLDALESVVDRLAAPSEGRRDLRLALYQVLDDLPEAQRDALAMTYIGGFTYDETAERLAVPLGTLKSRLRAGLKQLRDRLGEGVTR